MGSWTFKLVPIKDTQIKSPIPFPFTILLHLKSQCVWVGFFRFQVQITDDLSNREDSWENLVVERVDVIQFTSCFTMTTLQVMSEWLKELQLQSNTGIPFIVSYCQGLLMISTVPFKEWSCSDLESCFSWVLEDRGPIPHYRNKHLEARTWSHAFINCHRWHMAWRPLAMIVLWKRRVLVLNLVKKFLVRFEQQLGHSWDSLFLQTMVN